MLESIPIAIDLDLLRNINTTASKYRSEDGVVSISAVKMRAEPCWRRLLKPKVVPHWLTLDLTKVDIEGCQFLKERWRSSYFTSILVKERS